MSKGKRKPGKARHPKAAADVGRTLRDHPFAESQSARPGRLTAAGEKARALGAGMERRLRGLLRDDRMRRQGAEKKLGNKFANGLQAPGPAQGSMIEKPHGNASSGPARH